MLFDRNVIGLPFKRNCWEASRLFIRHLADELVLDTIASGATIMAAIDEYTTHHYLRQVYILSYAGTLVGASRIADYCAIKGIGATILLGLGAFGLGNNGFDLSFLHPATITKARYRQRAFEQFGGKNVSSVGWDFGSQVISPTKYRALCWVEAEVWGLHGSPALALERRPASPDLVSHEAPAYSGLHVGFTSRNDLGVT